MPDSRSLKGSLLNKKVMVHALKKFLPLREVESILQDVLCEQLHGCNQQIVIYPNAHLRIENATQARK